MHRDSREKLRRDDNREAESAEHTFHPVLLWAVPRDGLVVAAHGMQMFRNLAHLTDSTGRSHPPLAARAETTEAPLRSFAAGRNVKEAIDVASSVNCRCAED
jgi:hypothetical protein